MFTDAERDYLGEQRLVRLATASPSGRPHVVPLGFRLDGDRVVLSGWNMRRSLKYRQILQNPWVALVWDSPEEIRGMEVRGRAHVVEDPSIADPARNIVIEVAPTKVFSWGINEAFFRSFHEKMGYPLEHPAARRDPQT